LRRWRKSRLSRFSGICQRQYIYLLLPSHACLVFCHRTWFHPFRSLKERGSSSLIAFR
jgi:hypothetical protein